MRAPAPTWSRFAVLLLALAAVGAGAQQPPPQSPEAPGPSDQARSAAADPGGESPVSKGAPEKGSRFKDAQDGAFDCSDYLLTHRGFLPVPMIITEPAVGYGGGLGAVFFRQSFLDKAEKAKATGGRMSPPDIAALLAFKTSNGSWGAGGGYFGSAREDRFRYTALAAKMNLELDYYGPLDRAHRVDIDAPYVKADAMARLGESDWFLGTRYVYFGADCHFERDTPGFITLPDLQSDVGRLSLLVDYDSRDNLLTPSKGTFVEFDLGLARPGFGSTKSWESYEGKAYTYLPLGERVILGLRGEMAVTEGPIPFYAKPYVSLRGIAAMRFQGDSSATAETEVRWNLTPRWGLVFFGGAGKAYGGRTSFSEAEAAFGGGAGFRYLIARKLGLWFGVDAARGSGSSDTAIYFQVGSAWH